MYLNRTPSTTSRTSVRALLGGLALTGLVFGATACGDDDDDTAEAADDTVVETPATEAPAASDDVVVVEASDFSFGDLPEEVEAGTKFELKNTSSVELHELVAFRIPDEETRPLEELLPEAETIFGSAMPAMVLLAAPNGAEQIVAVGDGTLAEPGRYAFVCFIPTGADPEEFLAAAGPDGPPEVEGGAPHVEHGMFAEITVG